MDQLEILDHAVGKRSHFGIYFAQCNLAAKADATWRIGQTWWP